MIELRRVEVFVALCHGEREVVELPDATLVGADAIRFGVAFAQPMVTDDIAQELAREGQELRREFRERLRAMWCRTR